MALIPNEIVFCIMQYLCAAETMRFGCTRNLRTLAKEFLRRAERLPLILMLTVEQHAAAVDVLYNRRSVCILGDAGSGKTFTFNALIDQRKHQNVMVCCAAPTGIAATHCNGMTIHQLFGITVPSSCVSLDSGGNVATPIRHSALKRYAKFEYVLKNIATLFVDEISMLSEEIFGLMDERLRSLRNRDLPFGGVQLVLTGDPFQLPPVAEDERNPRSARFCFESALFHNMFCRSNGEAIVTVGKMLQTLLPGAAPIPSMGVIRILRESKRHETDKAFNAVLNDVRFGRISPRTRLALTSRLVSPRCRPCVQTHTYLYCTRNRVKEHNAECLQKLTTPPVTWHCFDAGEDCEYRQMLASVSVLEQMLTLRVGAPVLLRVNCTDKLVNGSRGEVVAIKRLCELGYGRCAIGQSCLVCSANDWEPSEPEYAELLPPGSDSTAVNKRKFALDTSMFTIRPVVKFESEELPLVVSPSFFDIHAPGNTRAKRKLDLVSSANKCAALSSDNGNGGPVASSSSSSDAAGNDEMYASGGAGRIVATRIQFPLCLAYSLTIHKSQGMTIDNLCLSDIGRAFAHGQVYVALSRARTLANITLVDDYLATRGVSASPASLDFWRRYVSVDTAQICATSLDTNGGVANAQTTPAVISGLRLCNIFKQQ